MNLANDFGFQYITLDFVSDVLLSISNWADITFILYNTPIYIQYQLGLRNTVKKIYEFDANNIFTFNQERRPLYMTVP